MSTSLAQPTIFFRFRHQTPLCRSPIGALIGKFLDSGIDPSPTGSDDLPWGGGFRRPCSQVQRRERRRAGEHWPPSDGIRLMANLISLPTSGKIQLGSYLLYDCACGTGGMLTLVRRLCRNSRKTPEDRDSSLQVKTSVQKLTRSASPICCCREEKRQCTSAGVKQRVLRRHT